MIYELWLYWVYVSPLLLTCRDLNAQVIANDDGNSGTQRKESRGLGEPSSDAEEARIREYLCRSDTAVIYPEPVEAASAPAAAAQQQGTAALQVALFSLLPLCHRFPCPQERTVLNH
ncbi:hypothetical protein MRX96_037829 [Rhipicephalus microplus]